MTYLYVCSTTVGNIVNISEVEGGAGWTLTAICEEGTEETTGDRTRWSRFMSDYERQGISTLAALERKFQFQWISGDGTAGAAVSELSDGAGLC